MHLSWQLPWGTELPWSACQLIPTIQSDLPKLGAAGGGALCTHTADGKGPGGSSECHCMRA